MQWASTKINFFLLGIFFAECGMYQSAAIVLSCVQPFQTNGDEEIIKMAMELWTRFDI